MVFFKQTAVDEGKVGSFTRDLFAMLLSIGYDMGDYFRHWMKIGTRLVEPPRIFHVNWFRKNEAGKFLWPGYSQNMRVLKWIIERVSGDTHAVERPAWAGCPATRN